MRETLGVAAGRVLAPLAAWGSALRGARLFHPHGSVWLAAVVPLARGGPAGALVARLSGQAMVRLSAALWKHGREWPDVLGCAVRFTGLAEPTEAPAPGDQDLLLATIRSPWTLALGPLTTDPHDYLANEYHGVSPFDLEGLGVARLHLVPEPAPGRRGTRRRRLEQAVAEHRAVLRLEAELESRPVRTPLVELRLLEALPLDQARLAFDPFRAGRGIRPRGFVHAMRLAVYAASRAARMADAEPEQAPLHREEVATRVIGRVPWRGPSAAHPPG